MKIKMNGKNFVEFIYPNKTSPMLWQEHINRYIFALRLTSKKVILDVACGTGYGTGLLSKTADLVIGVDISRQALTYARKHYGKMQNVDFVLSDAHNLPFREEAFDSVVSFETIEHLSNHKKFLQEVKRILRIKGRFVVSTPNKELLTKGMRPANPFHVKELGADEFFKLLNIFFKTLSFMANAIIL